MSTFAYLFQVADNVNRHLQNTLPCLYHKENVACYGNSHTIVLHWQQCFFFTDASFHTVYKSRHRSAQPGNSPPPKFSKTFWKRQKL